VPGMPERQSVSPEEPQNPDPNHRASAIGSDGI